MRGFRLLAPAAVTSMARSLVAASSNVALYAELGALREVLPAPSPDLIAPASIYVTYLEGSTARDDAHDD